MPSQDAAAKKRELDLQAARAVKRYRPLLYYKLLAHKHPEGEKGANLVTRIQKAYPSRCVLSLCNTNWPLHWPMAQCSGYGGYRKITRSSNAERGCCLDVTAERSYPCKRPACPAIGGGSEVTFKPLVPRLSVREGFLALTSPEGMAFSIVLKEGKGVTYREGNKNKRHMNNVTGAAVENCTVATPHAFVCK
ncbi:hypothetical protein J6590_093868 [Homalodisca vitripennis]|nr:hypothetical protein J6590_093868 [Homalodisca vitripennis]